METAIKETNTKVLKLSEFFEEMGVGNGVHALQKYLEVLSEATKECRKTLQP